MHLAGLHRPDEHGALRAERHHARVGDVLGEHLELEARRNDQGAKGPRGLLGQDGQAGAEGRRQNHKDEPPCRSLHSVSPNFVCMGWSPKVPARRLEQKLAAVDIATSSVKLADAGWVDGKGCKGC